MQHKENPLLGSILRRNGFSSLERYRQGIFCVPENVALQNGIYGRTLPQELLLISKPYYAFTLQKKGGREFPDL
ncbi:MAG: hypothetical protein HY001_03620 [Candidatus Portnoybacteria bacterium]|nr:hypothetical protein [Candidatus Portnoybacteria bacterium]